MMPQRSFNNEHAGGWSLLRGSLARTMIGCLLLAGLLAPARLGALESSWYLGGARGEKVAGGPLAASFENTPFGDVDSEDESYKLFAGLGLGRYFAVEAAFVDFGRQRFDAIADLGFAVDVDGYSAAVVVQWPQDRFILFGKAGALWWEEDGEIVSLAGGFPYSNDGRDLVLGAGLKYRLGGNVLARVEWERFEFDDEEADDYWVGLELRF